MTNTRVLAKVIHLRGSVPMHKARRYAKLVIKYSRKYKIDPYLLAALIHRESKWVATAVSHQNYGLMQLRVSKTNHSTLLGREHKLFHTPLNIQLGTKLLVMWRRYHQKHCKHNKHYWWSHYQWGCRVQTPDSGIRVWKEYQRYLKAKAKVDQAMW